MTTSQRVATAIHTRSNSRFVREGTNSRERKLLELIDALIFTDGVKVTDTKTIQLATEKKILVS